MNIGIYKRPRIGTVLTTVYFGGILVSVIQLPKDNLWVVGSTFFVGVLAIYFTARAKDEKVVYLEKREEATQEDKKTDTRRSQLDENAIREIIESNDDVPQRVLNEICNKLGAGQGAIYVVDKEELWFRFGYAVAINSITGSYKIGEGLVGRVAAEKQALYLDELPEGYITVFSGLGNTSPRRLALIPISSGVIEIATFTDINVSTLKHIEESCSEILK